MNAPWPKPDPEMLISETVQLPVQVNGKRRGEISVGASASVADIETAALTDEHVKPFLTALTVKKVIVVPGRIVNIVAS